MYLTVNAVTFVSILSNARLVFYEGVSCTKVTFFIVSAFILSYGLRQLNGRCTYSTKHLVPARSLLKTTVASFCNTLTCVFSMAKIDDYPPA